MIALATFLSGGDLGAVVSTDPGVPVLTEREAARGWHNTWWPQSYGVPMGFTGDVEQGLPGDISEDFRKAALLRYNIFRRMVGSRPFVLDSTLNAKAQLAALFIAANGKAQHGFWPTDARFYSEAADTATMECLLGLGWSNPEAAWGYIYDFGEKNVGVVGHRVALLAPWMAEAVGIGDVPASASTQPAEAFAIEGSASLNGFDPDAFVAWPCAGYVPHYLVTGQWSIDIPDASFSAKWSFKDTRITVLRNGEPLAVTGGERGASDGAVWSLDGTLEGATQYAWQTLAYGERLYGTPNREKDVVYHVRIEGVHERVVAFPGGPDLGGGALYQGTGRVEYDVIAYNPELPTRMRVRSAPVSQHVLPGGTALLCVEAEGVTNYQWYRDWEPLPGATQAWLEVKDFEASKAGRYHALLQGEGGALLSGYAQLQLRTEASQAGRLINVSTRALVGPGDGVLVAGFVLTGTQPKMVLVRGAGPALKGLMPEQELSDPKLRLFNAASEEILGNDDWGSGGVALLEAAATQVGAFPFARGSRDAVLFATLEPGLYTAHLSAQDGAPGVGLIEVYAVGDTGETRMINLSGRALNGLPGEPAIAGLVIGGTQKRRVLLRASGPALTGLVEGPLADPELLVFDASRREIARNDDWGTTPEAATALREAAAAVYAFPWTEGSRDAALLLELEPGLYTAHGRGKDGATGVVLVEAYELP